MLREKERGGGEEGTYVVGFEDEWFVGGGATSTGVWARIRVYEFAHGFEFSRLPLYTGEELVLLGVITCFQTNVSHCPYPR